MSVTAAWEVPIASTLNQKLRLANATLFGLEAAQVGGHKDPTLSYTLSLEPVVWARPEEGISAVYAVTVILEHVHGKSREPLAKLSVSIRLSYECHPSFGAKDLPAVEHYLGIVGWLHAWPYLRAEVQTLTGRLGFPPLMLNVLLAGQTAEVPVRRIEPPAPPASTAMSPPGASRRPKGKRKTARASRAR